QEDPNRGVDHNESVVVARRRLARARRSPLAAAARVGGAGSLRPLPVPLDGRVTSGGPRALIDLRPYRFAFRSAAVAVIALLFSPPSPPGPLRPLVAPAGFERHTAAHFTRQLIARAPRRPPGSSGDARAAAMVARTFRSIRAGRSAVQSFGPGGRL